MIFCYSLIDVKFNAEFGALVPNLTDSALDRLCRYELIIVTGGSKEDRDPLLP